MGRTERLIAGLALAALLVADAIAFAELTVTRGPEAIGPYVVAILLFLVDTPLFAIYWLRGID
jgi:hypothetical protein